MRATRRVRSKTMDWAIARDYRPLDEPVLSVESVMSKTVATCRPEDSLNAAAQIMWEHDCGCVPVVDADSRLIGILTDRDLCMAAYTQGKSLREISAGTICSRNVYSCHRDEPLWNAAGLMLRAQVRRLPVVDFDGRLAGILSLSDLARHASGSRPGSGGPWRKRVTSVLEAVSRPRSPAPVFVEPPSLAEREHLARFDVL